MVINYEFFTAQDTSSLSKQPDSYWTLSIEDAKKIVKHLNGVSRGSYEYTFYVKPIRSAVRAKQTEITIRTSGFSCSDFQRILEEVAGGYENLKEVGNILQGFNIWLDENYDYSGQGIDNENHWLSKSPTDYNIYSETQLKLQYKSTQNG